MNIFRHVFNKFFSLIEKTLYLNWFNPILTIYINLRLLPFSTAVKLPIWVFGRIKIMNLSGSCMINSEFIKSGMVRLNYNDIGSPDFMKFQTEVNVEGEVVFHGNTRIRTGCRIVVAYGAKLEFGKNTLICDNVVIGCLNNVSIGDNTWITHRCQVYDSNYHFVCNTDTMKVEPYWGYVKIGSNCWICNTTTIHKGIIPDGIIIASNSLVSGKIDAQYGSLVGGVPAKIISKGPFRLVTDRFRELEIIRRFKKTTDSFIIINDN